MPRDATPSGISEWIARNCRPKTIDAATLRFERMASQAAHNLPEIHTALDHRNPAHWFHRGMIWDYVFSLEGSQRVLDVGPGDGWPSLLIARHFKEVIGIEPGPNRLEVCKANAQKMRARNARFEMMSACDMSFRSGSFDGVVAASSIEQTPNPTAALSEIHRVLKVGGTLRMTYEVFDGVVEPVREAISIQTGAEGSFLIDYVVSWTERAEERNYLLEVLPLTEGNRKRLELWAKRCKDDAYPHRDPRLERGLGQTTKAIRKSEILKSHTFRIHHFKVRNLIRTLEKIGFTDIRPIAGGGWPAQQCGLEMIQSRRVEAAAPLMEEICRAAARIGIGLVTQRGGHLIARKAKGRATSRARTRAKPQTESNVDPQGQDKAPGTQGSHKVRKVQKQPSRHKKALD